MAEKRTDNLTSEERRYTMSMVRSTNTKPEMHVRRLLHGLGYRYRLHSKNLPGTPDMVFPGRKKVIFIHGCFWHGHSCRAGAKQPKTNRTYWVEKIKRNRIRDARSSKELKKLGWDIMVVWTCQIRANDRLQSNLVRFLDREN